MRKNRRRTDMEVKFKWNGRAGLRVLDEFIDGDIVEVQGLNGIGKSVAAQLLEIISGEHVFLRRGEFDSLKKALQNATISISGLPHKCSNLAVVLTPEKWILNADYQIEPNTIGEYSIDGESSKAENATSLLSTRIIRGNDTIISQMREVLIRNREEIINSLITAKSNYDMVQILKQEFTKISPEDNISIFKRAKESIANSEFEVNENKEQITYCRSIVTKLRNLIEIKEQITELESADFPKLEGKIARMEQELLTNQNEQGSISKEAESIQESVSAKSLENETQIKNIYNRLSSLEREEDRFRTDLANQLRDIESVYEKFEHEELEKELRVMERSNSENIRNLESKWEKVSKNQELANVGHSLVFRLIPTIAKGLGDRVIAQGEIDDLGTVVLSMSRLEILINNRIVILDQEMANLPEDQYRREADSLGNQRQQILKSLSTLRKLKNKGDQIERLSLTLNRLQASIDQSSAERLHTLKNTINERREQELFLRIEINRMRETFDRLSKYPDLNELKDRYQSELSELRITEEIEGFYESQQRKLISLEFRIDELEKDIKDNKIVINKIGNDFSKQIQKLSQDKNLMFFITDSSPETIEESMNVVEEAHDNMREFLDHCEKTVFMLTQVRDSINTMIDQIQGKDRRTTEYENIIEILRDIYNRFFVSLYREPEYLEYVFKEFETVVRFDMEENNIILKGHDGQEYLRPLDAFSSGEKAFAFSLAMIAITTKRDEANKVLILDEFGALLDYERSEVLKRYLKEKVEKEKLADKVILMLPAREELKEQIDKIKIRMATEKEKIPALEKDLKRLEQLQADLEQKGYFQYVWEN